MMYRVPRHDVPTTSALCIGFADIVDGKNTVCYYKSKDALIDYLVEHMPNPDNAPEAERRRACDGWLSALKHWKA